VRAASRISVYSRQHYLGPDETVRIEFRAVSVEKIRLLEKQCALKRAVPSY
jgi:hypothetical protein